MDQLTVEAVNGLLPEASSDASINTFVFITLELQEIFKQIQHLCHLKHIRLLLLRLKQNVKEQCDLCLESS